MILLRKSKKAWCSELTVDGNRHLSLLSTAGMNSSQETSPKTLYNTRCEQACKLDELHLQKNILETMKTKAKNYDKIN